MNTVKTLCVTCFLILCNISHSQNIATFMRSLDNNRAIAEDSTEWKFHRALKNIPIGKNSTRTNLSFGGEIRQRLRYMNHMNFGDVRPGTNDKDLFWMQRYMIHADLNAGRNIRFFTQLHSCHVVFKEEPTPGIDVDKLDLMQAFVDIRFGQKTSVLFRFGRQDINYGSGLFIGTRDGPNVRQTYDGIFTSVRTRNIKSDFFLVKPALSKPSFFDNAINKDFLVYAAYLTMNVTEANILELYYFGTNQKNARFDENTATDNRHSMGIRLSNRNSPLNYNIEFTGQLGKFGNMKIRSWQLASVLGYRWDHLPLHPGIESRQLILSGDPHSEDNIVNSFRPVSSRPPICEMVPAGSANIMVFNPAVQVEFTRFISFSVSYYAVWRHTTYDGIYNLEMNAPRIRDRDEPGTDYDKLYCQGVYGAFQYSPNQHFLVSLISCVFFPETYLKATGAGQNLQATALRFTYWF